MPNKAVISLATGLEDPEKVTVAYLVAVGAAESGRPTLMFLTKEVSAWPSPASRSGSPATDVRLSPTWFSDTRRRAAGTSSVRSASTPRSSPATASSPALRSKAPFPCGSGSATARRRSATSPEPTAS